MKSLRFILLFVGAFSAPSLHSAKNQLDQSNAVTDPVRKATVTRKTAPQAPLNVTVPHCVAIKQMDVVRTDGVFQEVPFKDSFSYLRGQCDPVFDAANAPFMWDDTNNAISGNGYGGTNPNLFKDPSIEGFAKPQDEVICGLVNHTEGKKTITLVVRGQLEEIFNKYAQPAGYLYLYKGRDDTMNQRNYYMIKKVGQKPVITNNY